ncbi:MAG: UDP-N-acetylglucosamine 1-carboxyvinyltransferase [Patescibacteria group bacterium]
MSTFVIEGLAGKKTLKGSIKVNGAKNAVLPMMAASVLIRAETILTNVPAISDVAAMGKILEGLGATVVRTNGTLELGMRELSSTVLDHATAKSLRASILLTGPVLARMGSVSFPHPGGDLIGERPIDLFAAGLQALGATVTEFNDSYTFSAPQGLKGGDYFFSTVSVTGTEALMMAATLARGKVTLRNAALEPEVVALAEFLISAGAKIEGVGTATIVITPTALHSPPPAAVIPDRIEAATFLALGALAAEELTVEQVRPHHLDAVLDVIMRMGVRVNVGKDYITVRAPEVLQPVRVRTHEHPGFPTDAHPPTMVLLTQAHGESIMIESIFDGRLAYTEELCRMGAEITCISPHRARVVGKRALRAADIETPDIRAGLAFILAGIVAEGTTRVGNAHLVDRGYEKIEERLRAIGVAIRREE